MIIVRSAKLILLWFLIFGSFSGVFSQNYYDQNFRKGYYYLDVSISQAAEYFGKAIMNDSTQPEAYFYRGLAYYKMDEFGNAIRDFKKSLEIDTTLVKINVFISFAYRGLNDWDKALESFNEYMISTSIDSTSFNWLMRGKLKQLNGDITGALEDFKKAVFLSPEQEKFRFYLFLTELEQKNFQAALEQINEMINHNPEFYGYYFYKGNIYFQMMKFNEAIENYTVSIEKNNNNPDGYFRRAWSADTLSNYTTALADYGRAIDLKSDDAAYYAKRGNLLYRMAKIDDACKDWAEANKLHYYKDYEKLNKLCK